MRGAGVFGSAVLVVAVAVGWQASAGAGVSQASTGPLPAPTFSTTTIHLGERVTVTGTGCVAPGGDGTTSTLRVSRMVPIGRAGKWIVDEEFPVRADGSYTGSFTVSQPIPDGPSSIDVDCWAKDPAAPTGETHASASVPVTLVAPSLPDLTAAAGSALDLRIPCGIESGFYGEFVVTWSTGVASIGGSYVGDDSVPNAGDLVHLPVPAGSPLGTFPATAYCGENEQGESAFFAHFTVTITPPIQQTPPTVAPAPPAPKTAGDPAFTG